MNHRLRTIRPPAIRGRQTPAGLLVALLLPAGLLLLVGAGCDNTPTPSETFTEDDSEAESTRRDDLFDIALTNLDRIEQFEGTEMLEQTVNRLDQWVGDQKPLPESIWRVDPMVADLVASLPDFAEQMRAIASDFAALKNAETPSDPTQWLGEIANRLDRLARQIEQSADQTGFAGLGGFAGQMMNLASQTDPGRLEQLGSQLDYLAGQLDYLAAEMDLAKLEFSGADGFALREVVWLRDVSNWARGDEVDALDRAKRLFDWTVRNVQLDPYPAARDGRTPVRVLQKPWETLLFGRGTAMDRAWVFSLLARQQHLDVALLALVDPDDPEQKRLRPWVVAVLIQGELYLFDPALGLPIPAPDGVTCGPQGPLEIRPATLGQAAADDAVLRQLDVDETYRYPVNASQLEGVVALLEASPVYLTQRMKLVENRLAGDEKMVLTASPTRQAERFKACRQKISSRLWPLPYEALFQELLLGPERHKLQGAALTPFLAAIGRTPALWKGRVYHLKGKFIGEPSATYYYQMARPSNRELSTAKIDPQATTVYLLGKLDASYWLGLIAAQLGNQRAAVDYLAKRTVEFAPGGPRTYGAVYNLARIYEAGGEFQKAIKFYRANSRAPGAHGNLLRARWLESLTTPASPEPPEDEPAGQPEV